MNERPVARMDLAAARANPLIAAIIAARAADRPTAAAIRAPGRDALTYGGLHAAMGRVAETLAQMGFGRGARVAVVLPNGPEMAVTFLAVTSAATCAPLNPRLNERDFAFSFGDLGASAVIVEGDRIPAAVTAARRLALPLIELVPQLDGPAGTFALRGDVVDHAARSHIAESEDVALVLHTSGTTARPKIVPLTQRNLSVSAANIGRFLELAADDSCLNVMPLFHIHGLVGALLASMAAGASVMCTAGFRGSDFARWLRDCEPTWYTAVPTVHQAVLDACGSASLAPHRLRFIRSSSAALPPGVLHALTVRFGVPVIEAYGMTEAAHQMASNPLRGVQKPGSVGLPAGPEIAVMDDAGRLLPSRSVGELVIRGETVMKGYERNPEANAAAFVDGWFRTGDQGYIDDSGYAFLTGRLKELINRGGEKIAPREVEEALLRHAAVSQAVAFAIPHERLGEDVGAAVVLKDGMHATNSDLRGIAADHLPLFKVPRRIAIVAAIPTGPTGKVQRTGLAATLGLTDRNAESAAPRTPLEQHVTAEWQRLLGLAHVGVDDDFFALGGDSLLATEMIEAMTVLLHVEVPIADFLERPTISRLIELRQRALAAGAMGVAGVVPVRMGGSGVPIFCTSGHEGLWRVSRLIHHLAKNAPIHGLPLPPIGPHGPVPTVEELAQRHVAALQRIQPTGPVHLVGPCFGGVVALEMATQLERMGRPVALLVMINCFNHAWRRMYPEKSRVMVRGRHLIHRIRFHSQNLRQLGREKRMAYLRARSAATLDHWGDEARRLLFEMAIRSGLPHPQWVRQIAFASRHARMRYDPKPYAGHVLMVRAVAPSAGVYPLPHMGWSRVLEGQVDMLEVPCDALEFWSDEPILEQVAARITALLVREWLVA